MIRVLSGSFMALAICLWPRMDHGRRDCYVRGSRQPPSDVGQADPRRLPPQDDAIPDLLLAVAAQLRAGVSPMMAWIASCDACRFNPDLESYTSSGGQAVQTAWRLADRTGAPLAQILEAVAERIRDRIEHEAELAAELAGPQATVKLLLALPLLGLVLGQAIGADPLGVIITTAAGRVCAVLGFCLLLTGKLWIKLWISRLRAAM